MITMYLAAIRATMRMDSGEHPDIQINARSDHGASHHWYSEWHGMDRLDAAMQSYYTLSGMTVGD